MQHRHLGTIVAICSIVFLSTPSSALAMLPLRPSGQPTTQTTQTQTGECKPDPEKKIYCVENKLPAKTIPEAIGLVAKLFTGICGSLALIMFVYGGFLWLTAAGNSERIEKGKKIFIWSSVGLAIIFGSYAIITQIYKTLGAY